MEPTSSSVSASRPSHLLLCLFHGLPVSNYNPEQRSRRFYPTNRKASNAIGMAQLSVLLPLILDCAIEGFWRLETKSESGFPHCMPPTLVRSHRSTQTGGERGSRVRELQRRMKPKQKQANKEVNRHSEAVRESVTLFFLINLNYVTGRDK